MTPKEIDQDITKLLELIGAVEIPLFLNVEPEEFSEEFECFPNVKEKISRDGGAEVLGWQIWKTDILVEAEFHAVWRSPEGRLKDITPKQPEITKILFLADDEAEYLGVAVDNIRLNITDNRLVEDFVEVAKAIFRLQNKGDRAHQYGALDYGHEEGLHNDLNIVKAKIYQFIKVGGSRRSSCFCSSDKKYKHCHEKTIKKWVAKA